MPPYDVPPVDRDWLEVCRRRCTFATCTGRGDLVHHAHRCALAPDAVVELPPCHVPDCERVDTARYINGWYCPDHAPARADEGHPGSRPPPETVGTQRDRVKAAFRAGVRYGPHDPATAPTTVTVLTAHKYPVEVEAPRHPALIRQRQAINDEAGP